MTTKELIENHQQTVEQVYALIPVIEQIAEQGVRALKNGNKLLICGNGGSAADAQHFAAEIVGRFTRERRGYPAIALTTDTSILTAIGNDYGYDTIFSRQVEALAGKGDIVIGLSTSGNSPNVLKAFELAAKMECTTVALLGKDGGSIKDHADFNLIINSNITARVQECHILIIHILCEIIERELTK